jgi:hypothetical protein
LTLQWTASQPGTDGDDLGFSLHFSSADEAVVTKEAALDAFWERMLHAILPAYASTAWDTVAIDVWLGAGRIFGYPMHSRALERPVGPGCRLDLANLRRRIVALAVDETVSKDDYRAHCSEIAEEYAKAIVSSATRAFGCEAVSGRWLLYDGTPRLLLIELTPAT